MGLKVISNEVRVCERSCQKHEEGREVIIPTKFLVFVDKIKELGAKKKGAFWCPKRKVVEGVWVKVTSLKETGEYKVTFFAGNWPLRRKFSVLIPVCFGLRMQEVGNAWQTVLRGHCAGGLENFHSVVTNRLPSVCAAIDVGAINF